MLRILAAIRSTRYLLGVSLTTRTTEKLPSHESNLISFGPIHSPRLCVPSSVFVPLLFQFLSKTVSGVIHTIKDALPHFDDDAVQSESRNYL